MRRGVTVLLKILIVLIGIGTLAFLLWEPHVEGRNANATLFEIYFNDPFLAYVYAASILFFVGLYHAFKVLGHLGRNEERSPAALRSLRTIRYCALALIGAVALGEVFIMSIDSDDRAGGVFMGILVAFASIVVATAATFLERAFRNAAHMNSEGNSTA